MGLTSMTVSSVAARSLPFVIVFLLMLNATAGFWYCKGHASAEGVMAGLHLPGHMGCPPGSHDALPVTERGTDPAASRSAARLQHPIPIENRGLAGAASRF